MKVVGLAIAYSNVPLDESDSTAEDQLVVEQALIPSDIEEEPRNGSLRPH